MNKKFESTIILTQECIKGNRLAQDVLFKQFYNPMLYTVMGYTKDISLAKDIVHEGFIKVFNKLPAFDSNRVLAVWIKKVIVNTAIDALRKHDYRVYNLNYELEDVPDEEEKIIKRDLIDKAIENLPPQFKLNFKLYVIEDKTHKEISQMLGISENTSKTNYHRAKLKLRAELKDKIEDLFY